MVKQRVVGRETLGTEKLFRIQASVRFTKLRMTLMGNVSQRMIMCHLVRVEFARKITIIARVYNEEYTYIAIRLLL